jgi:hypothetical protein
MKATLCGGPLRAVLSIFSELRRAIIAQRFRLP